ncbi:MAG: cardiolipin synthase [Candidatus Pristimantibacillus sp.]
MAGWLLGLIIVLILYMAQIAAILLLERARPIKLVAWILISMLIPFIGFIAFILIGRSYAIKNSSIQQFQRSNLREAQRSSLLASEPADIGNEEFSNEEQLYRLLTADHDHRITLRNRTTVLTNGRDTFDAILDEMESAEHHIHLDYYTIRDDGVGRRFLDLLTNKARAGIEVRVIYDGIGSMNLSDQYVQALRDAGVQTSCFLPPRVAFYDRLLNNRNHSKIVVIDGRVGFVGGINIGDEYIGKDKKLGFWRDTQLRLEGDSVYYLQELFMKDWAFAAKEQLSGPRYMPDQRFAGEEAVLIVSSGPDRKGEPILGMVFTSVMAAKSRVYLSTPYFIPSESLLMALRSAAMSGVDVRVIIPGIADTKLVLWATLSYIEPLLEAGVKVYRYQKGFIHAKVMLIDRMLASVGTANMDMRSFYSNFEQNAMLFDEHTIDRLSRDFEQDLRDSVELDLVTFRSRSRQQKAKEAFAHLLSPLL